MSGEIVNMTELQSAISSARMKLSALSQKFPTEGVFHSILKQLDYIEGLTLGTADASRISDLNMGFLGLRFVVDFDDELGHCLSEIEHFARTKL